MKKIENFSRSLAVLEKADFDLADENEIYRTGVIGQFNITFELAWKALQEVMRKYGISGTEAGSPREILQTVYQSGFLNDQYVWLNMLRKRNTVVHIYDENEADDLVLLIKNSFIPELRKLLDTLEEKDNKINEDAL